MTYQIKPGNNFGVAILGLMEDELQGDFDSGIERLSNNTGLSEEDIVELIEADELAVDEELFEAVASTFYSTSHDPNVLNGLYLTALDANAAIDINEYLDEAEDYEEDEDEDYEEDEEDEEYEDEEELAEQSYSRNSRNTANFAEVETLRNKVADIETLFSIKNALTGITKRADDLADAGVLPPIARHAIVASFADKDEQVAAFSQMCDANERTPDELLFAMNYALSIFERCGTLVDFNHYTDDEIDPEVAAFSAELDSVAKRSLEAMGPLLN